MNGLSETHFKLNNRETDDAQKSGSTPGIARPKDLLALYRRRWINGKQLLGLTMAQLRDAGIDRNMHALKV